MSYREVRKDDVGKEVEVLFGDSGDSGEWEKGRLYGVHDVSDYDGASIVTFCDQEWFVSRPSHVRIRTSPLPDGWLPDDWRVLGDDEMPKIGDVIILVGSTMKPFSTSDIYVIDNGHPYRLNWTRMTASKVVSSCGHHLCVIRPRWRPAAKDDVGKSVYCDDNDIYALHAVLGPDQYGNDCVINANDMGHKLYRLKNLKVENEGWHVN